MCVLKKEKKQERKPLFPIKALAIGVVWSLVCKSQCNPAGGGVGWGGGV